jgi:hypothetical protein
LMYIAATNQVVSSALVVERAEDGKEHGVQRPVYYLSMVLSPTKQRYPHYQKYIHDREETAALLRMPLHHSSGLNPSLEYTQQPRRHGTCFALGHYPGPWEIMYQWQLAIKSQVLPDLIAKWTKA